MKAKAPSVNVPFDDVTIPFDTVGRGSQTAVKAIHVNDVTIKDKLVIPMYSVLRKQIFFYIISLRCGDRVLMHQFQRT